MCHTLKQRFFGLWIPKGGLKRWWNDFLTTCQLPSTPTFSPCRSPLCPPGNRLNPALPAHDRGDLHRVSNPAFSQVCVQTPVTRPAPLPTVLPSWCLAIHLLHNWSPLLNSSSSIQRFRPPAPGLRHCSDLICQPALLSLLNRWSSPSAPWRSRYHGNEIILHSASGRGKTVAPPRHFFGNRTRKVCHNPDTGRNSFSTQRPRI